MATDLTGQTVGNFYVEGPIGKGAMGAVYRAKAADDRVVAIKVVDPASGEITPLMLKRFEREIELLQRFRHKHIVKFQGSGTHKGVRFYAMEFVEGESLEAVLAKQRVLPLSQACQYIWQLCDALEEMHSEGVVHRDLKPANIIIDKTGAVKLTDLGIAKDTTQVFNSKLTEADTTVGTVAYMAPEQLAGKDLSRRSDLYAMGIMFYQLVTGRLPFTGKTVFDYINQRQAGIFPKPSLLNSRIPGEIDELICGLMQNDPEDRPRDARVVQQRIKEIAEKSRKGTLTKTAVADDGALAQTEVLTAVGPAASKPKAMMQSLGGAILGSLTGSGTKKRKKKSQEPFWESPLFLGGSLVLVAAFVTWMLWPLSEAQLFERGKALMASQYRSDWDTADEKFFTPLLKRYPNTAHTSAIQDYRDKILVTDCDERVKNAHRLGRLPDDAVEAFRKYYEADSLRLMLNNNVMANAQFKAIADLFENDPPSRGWVLLARKQLTEETKVATESDRTAAKRAALTESVTKANDLKKAGKIPDYFRICDGIVSLYGNDKEVEDIVKKVQEDVAKARELLQGQ